MLSIDICRECRNNTKGNIGWGTRSTEIFNSGLKSLCPVDPSGVSKYNYLPPERCPYKFQHAIALGMEDAE